MYGHVIHVNENSVAKLDLKIEIDGKGPEDHCTQIKLMTEKNGTTYGDEPTLHLSWRKTKEEKEF